MSLVGQTAKKLRKSLGWTQRETADLLEVSYVHLCNIENGKTKPSQALLDRYCDLWGIDLYVFTWCDQGDIETLPPSVRNAATNLSKAWQKKIDELIKENNLGRIKPCSTFRK